MEIRKEDGWRKLNDGREENGRRQVCYRGKWMKMGKNYRRKERKDEKKQDDVRKDDRFKEMMKGTKKK